MNPLLFYETHGNFDDLSIIITEELTSATKVLIEEWLLNPTISIEALGEIPFPDSEAGISEDVQNPGDIEIDEGTISIEDGDTGTSISPETGNITLTGPGIPPIDVGIIGIQPILPCIVSTYPPEYNSTYVKATTYHLPAWFPHLSVDPDNPLAFGDSAFWQSELLATTNQRFHIALASPVIINKIYFENASSTAGVRQFTVQGSNELSAFEELTYNINTNWVDIPANISELTKNPPSDVISYPQYAILTNTIAYQYYALKFATNWGQAYMCIHRAELQTVT